jgi:hypothetical protein
MRIKLTTLVLGTDAQDIYPTISLCHLWHPILVNTREILLTNDVSYRYNKSSLYHQLLNSVKLGSSFTSLEVERYDWRWVGQLESYTSLEVERYDEVSRAAWKLHVIGGRKVWLEVSKAAWKLRCNDCPQFYLLYGTGFDIW